METETQEAGVKSAKSADARFADALAGRYQFSIADMFDEALAKTTGIMGVFWGAFGLLMLVAFGIGILLGILNFILGMIIIMSTGKLMPPLISTILTTYIPMIVLNPLFAGFWMICIRYVARQSVRVMMIFAYFKTPKKYWLQYVFILLITLIATVPVMLLKAILHIPDASISHFTVESLLPGFLNLLIIMGVSSLYAFSLPLLADRNLDVWGALEASRKAIIRHWFKVIAAFVLISLMAVVIPGVAIVLMGLALHKAFMLLFVSFIWLLPFSAVCSAILYRDIFGVSSAQQ